MESTFVLWSNYEVKHSELTVAAAKTLQSNSDRLITIFSIVQTTWDLIEFLLTRSLRRHASRPSGSEGKYFPSVLITRNSIEKSDGSAARNKLVSGSKHIARPVRAIFCGVSTSIWFIGRPREAKRGWPDRPSWKIVLSFFCLLY